MPGHADPEALLPKYEPTPRKHHRPSWSSEKPYLCSSAGAAFGRRIRGVLRLAIFSVAVLFVFFVLSTRHGEPVRNWVKDRLQADTVGQNTNEDLDLDIPPRYLGVVEAQRILPQHNLSLPYPEGATGRYVKFTSQINMLGWNNVYNELLMLTYLAYKSRRAYVFQDYVWKQDDYPWPEDKAWELPSRTPLSALISGPTVGGPWEPGDPAPRSIHEKHWAVVCPKEKVKIIWTHEVKRKFKLQWEKSAKQIFDAWTKILLDEPAQCIEVAAPPRDVETFGQVFDLRVWGTDRILNIWEEFRDSPVSQLLQTSPVVERAVARNEHLFGVAQTDGEDGPFSRTFAVHVHHDADFVAACSNLANFNSTFYSWNLLPFLPDRFSALPGSKGSEENIKAYLLHCSPDTDQIIRRITEARNDWERELFGDRMVNHFINTLYVLTARRGKSKWLDNLIARLENEHKWKIITSHDITFGDSQEKDVAMAVDMELARRSAIFMGNGWSSFTSNILHRRLVDGKVPISNRFF